MEWISTVITCHSEITGVRIVQYLLGNTGNNKWRKRKTARCLLKLKSLLSNVIYLGYLPNILKCHKLSRENVI